ncbi:MAG: phage holin family protein [Candidatus Pseudoruminococcus sp.]|nr:phage holin family protein [Candidatus Pseudoruminococcus sp.]
MNITDFIKPELMILIPVLYLVGVALKKCIMPDKYIPIVLGCAGIILSTIYLLSITQITSVQDVWAAIFAAITQGILCAGASVYANQIYKQIKKDD